MKAGLRRLWAEDAGYVITLEVLLVATLLAIGVVSALVALRNAAVAEMTEVANAVLALNQSFSFAGLSNCKSYTAGSAYFDAPDFIRAQSVAVSGQATVSVNDSVCD